MNFDPMHTVQDKPEVHEDPAIDSTAAGSSLALPIAGIVTAVVLVVAIVAISPWGDDSDSNVTPGQGGEDLPLPGERFPDNDRQINPRQPQVVPTVGQPGSR
jgi:hypothetical protein